MNDNTYLNYITLTFTQQQWGVCLFVWGLYMIQPGKEQSSMLWREKKERAKQEPLPCRTLWSSTALLEIAQTAHKIL